MLVWNDSPDVRHIGIYGFGNLHGVVCVYVLELG
jgi:hypothetical protein